MEDSDDIHDDDDDDHHHPHHHHPHHHHHHHHYHYHYNLTIIMTLTMIFDVLEFIIHKLVFFFLFRVFLVLSIIEVRIGFAKKKTFTDI